MHRTQVDRVPDGGIYIMGLTSQSTGSSVLERKLKIEPSGTNEKVVALAGNPNVGKSTVFNGLTGLNQHTGNWPGKTVSSAQGRYRHRDMDFIIVDIPGTYSLMANSAEEEIARDFVCFGSPDATVIVTDATCLERNLNLVLQAIEITANVVVCVNLLDEAKRKRIKIDLAELSTLLGVPVIGTSARSGSGLIELMDAVYHIADRRTIPAPIRIHYEDVIEQAVRVVEPFVRELLTGRLNSRWVTLRLLEEDQKLLDSLTEYLGFDITQDISVIAKLKEAQSVLNAVGIKNNLLRDKIVSEIVCTAEKIASKVVHVDKRSVSNTDRKIDNILTSRIFGIPIMIALLAAVFWLTITGSNYPSKWISSFLFWIEDQLSALFVWAGAPSWIHGLFVTGMYRTLAWVVSVMLPPMAIFFPLFTLLEDLGYLPRVAFNLDHFFKKACTHGKQALTMCMGFGCNAAGIVGCRIIDSPRERLIAIITNNFVPCNGRFPQPHKEQ